MRFNVTLFDKLSLRHRRREAKLEEWHKWFAWYPVIIECQIVWLEVVARRSVMAEYHDMETTEYRLMETYDLSTII